MIRRYFPLFLIIFSFLSAQQRPPSNVVKRPAGGKMTSLRDLDFEVIKLSYIETDRALAILKTMGILLLSSKPAREKLREKIISHRNFPIRIWTLMRPAHFR